MNKKIFALLLSGMMIIPMTGCNAHLTIGGKEIFNFSDEKEVQQEITHEHNVDERKYTDEEILSSLKEGTFVVNYKDTEYKFILETLLNELYEDTTYTVTYIGNNVYNIQVGNSDNSKFMEFELIGGTTTLSIVSYYDGNTLYTDEDANAMFTNTIAELIENEDIGNKEEEVKEEPKKEEEKEEPKQEKKQETPKICKWCYTNQLPSGSNENDKCQECQQENWNFYCNDCGKSMTLEEYWSYGHDTGFCPPCYDKYIQATTTPEETVDDHKHYYCDRCGKDVTFLNFLQDFEGWGIICEGCLLELGY